MKYRAIYSIVLLSVISDSSATNLDPLKGCVNPETRDELQGAIDMFELANPSTNPRMLELCKGTKVQFVKNDARIFLSIPSGKSFLLKCESLETCVIDGGNTGRHEDNSREQVGSGGFLNMSSFTSDGLFLYFEGIKFTNFGASNDGGVFHFFNSASFHISFYKCRFTTNYSKFHGGVMLIDGYGGKLTLNIKDCDFVNNDCDASGGAIHLRNIETEEEFQLRDSHFNGNWAKGNGGAIALSGITYSSVKRLYVTNCDFHHNKANSRGGAIFASFVSPFHMKKSKFNNNIAGVHGEAYFVNECNLNFMDNDFNEDTTFENGAANTATFVNQD